MATGPQRALNFLMTNSSALHFVVDSGIGRAVGRSNVVVARLFAPLVVGGMLVSTFIELAVLCVKLPVTVLQFFANVRIVNLSVGENLADIGRTALRIVFFTATFFVSVIIPKTLFAAFERAHAEERCLDCQNGRPNRLPPGAGVGRPVGRVLPGLGPIVGPAAAEVRPGGGNPLPEPPAPVPHRDAALPAPLREAQVEEARMANQRIVGQITGRFTEIDALVMEMAREENAVRGEGFQGLARLYREAIQRTQTALEPIRGRIRAAPGLEVGLLRRQDRFRLDGFRNLRPGYQRDLESVQTELATLRTNLATLRRDRREQPHRRAQGQEALQAQRRAQFEAQDIARREREEAHAREMAQRRAVVEGLAPPAAFPIDIDIDIDIDAVLDFLIGEYRQNPNPEILAQIDEFMTTRGLRERRPERVQQIMEELNRIQDQAMIAQLLPLLFQAALPGDANAEEAQRVADADFEEEREHGVLGSGLPADGAQNAGVQRLIETFVRETLVRQHQSTLPLQREGVDYTAEELRLAQSIWNTTLSLGRQASLRGVFGEARGNELYQALEANPPRMGTRVYVPEQLQLFNSILTEFRGAGAARQEYVGLASQLFGEDVAEKIVDAYIYGEEGDDEVLERAEATSLPGTPTAARPLAPPPIPLDVREDHRILELVLEGVTALVEGYRTQGHPDLRRDNTDRRNREEVLLGEKIFHISQSLYQRDRGEAADAQEALFVDVFGDVRGQLIYRALKGSPPQLLTYTQEQRTLAFTVFERFCQEANEADVRRLFGTLFENRAVAEKLASHILRDELVRRHRADAVNLNLDRGGPGQTPSENTLFQAVWRLSSTDSNEEKRAYFVELCGEARGERMYNALLIDSMRQRRALGAV